MRPVGDGDRDLRLWRKVKRAGPDECWEWQGTLDPSGYGSLPRKAKSGKWCKGYAHRRAWESAYGRDLRHGEVVRHTCDNPRCCNPVHLRVGSQADNLRDMREKGRDSKPPVNRGESHPGARLDADDVENIRALEPTLKRAEVAELFGVATATVKDIQTRRTWK
jgi:hypothetical protein